MLEHHAKIFYYATIKLCKLLGQVDRAIEERGSDALPSLREADLTRALMISVGREAERLNFTRVLIRLRKFHVDDELLQPSGSGRRAFTLGQLQWQIEELDEAITEELSKNSFMMIPIAKVEYYDNLKLFGDAVSRKFPEANREIREAGNCFATGNNAACIFHLMRGVEHGARAMVRALNIRVGDKTIGIRKGELPFPVMLCEWGTLVRVFNETLDQLTTRTSDEASKRAAFYKEAVVHFALLKDAWRNPLSHTRFAPDDYDPHKTMSVIINTRHFMEHLASRLQEDPIPSG